MERRFVYPVQVAPDAALAHVERTLQADGFSVATGREYDVNARRGGDRVLVGIAPHPQGLVARVKCKALLPGRSDDLVERVETILSEHLGPHGAGGGRHA